MLVVACLSVFALITLASILAVYTFRASQFDLNCVVNGRTSSMMYDSQNRPIALLDGRRVMPVRWEEIPQHLMDAFVAREDETFFQHGGIVYRSVVRSFLSNVESMRYQQGASTITMQLARNVFELQEKTLDRKLLEMVLARMIEKKYDKSVIFTEYLNCIYYGQGCYGIATAADLYFGKHVSQLTLPECALLAGVVRAPSTCNPVTNMENALGVREETLARMLTLGLITQEEHDAANATPIQLAPAKKEKERPSSYVSMWVDREMAQLQELAGENTTSIAVVSTVDIDVQQKLETAAELALRAVESTDFFPDSWREQLMDTHKEKDLVDAVVQTFLETRRPEALPRRGAKTEVDNALQCCALVVDCRRNRRGNVLGVLSGRSAADSVDRWQHNVMPGRALAPLVHVCACLPGGESSYIVAEDTCLTGRGLGYDNVRGFFDSLNLRIPYPSREREDDLYAGLFEMRRIDLARLLFDLINDGRDCQFHSVHSIWNRGQKLIYSRERKVLKEYIRRESAKSVLRIAPFIREEGKPLCMNLNLPESQGAWTIYATPGSVAVLVWMGFDKPTSAVMNRDVNKLLKEASLYFAREVHAGARAAMK